MESKDTKKPQKDNDRVSGIKDVSHLNDSATLIQQKQSEEQNLYVSSKADQQIE